MDPKVLPGEVEVGLKWLGPSWRQWKALTDIGWSTEWLEVDGQKNSTFLGRNVDVAYLSIVYNSI